MPIAIIYKDSYYNSQGGSEMPARITDTAILVGKRLAEQRKIKGLTMAQLAKTCKVSSAHISDIENGHRQPSLELFKRLCLALGVSADTLLGIDTSKLDEPATAA